MKTKNLRPEIIYQDDSFVIVNKPPGLLSIPDRWRPEISSVKGFLNSKFGEIFTVHRLDKETSGLMVFCKNQAAHRHLSLQFEHRTVDKKYLVLVEGTVVRESGSIDNPIGPRPGKPGVMRISPKGKPSLTEYKLIDQFEKFALVEATIKTGRMHQIRVHFESIGLPLAIDESYGRRTNLSIAEIKKGKIRVGKNGEPPKPLMHRSSLHAYQLTIKHPESEELMTFKAELPKDFRAVLNCLEKWGR